LRLVLQHSDHSGYPTNLPGLETFFRRTVPDIKDRELVDALKRLCPKYLTLRQWSNEKGRFVEYPAEIGDDAEFFYRGSMQLRRTPESDPRVQELAALLAKSEQEEKVWKGVGMSGAEAASPLATPLVGEVNKLLNEIPKTAHDSNLEAWGRGRRMQSRCGTPRNQRRVRTHQNCSFPILRAWAGAHPNVAVDSERWSPCCIRLSTTWNYGVPV
jgi:hypothetical protein